MNDREKKREKKSRRLKIETKEGKRTLRTFGSNHDPGTFSCPQKASTPFSLFFFLSLLRYSPKEKTRRLQKDVGGRDVGSEEEVLMMQM